MTRIAIPLLTLAVVLFAGLSARGQDTAPADHDDETPLAKHMLLVEDGLRALRRSIRDPEKSADALATVVECQHAVLFCKTETPVLAGTVPEEEREAFVRDYRTQMIGVMDAFLELERALLEGQDVDALKAIYTRIKGLEDPGHDRFTEDG